MLQFVQKRFHTVLDTMDVIYCKLKRILSNLARFLRVHYSHKIQKI